MQFPHAFDPRMLGKRLDIEAQANLDVLLREVVAVNQHFANLFGGIGILALVGVVVLEQELAVAVLDDRLRMSLNLRHHAQDFGDLDVERRLGAVVQSSARHCGALTLSKRNKGVKYIKYAPQSNLWHAQTTQIPHKTSRPSARLIKRGKHSVAARLPLPA